MSYGARSPFGTRNDANIRSVTISFNSSPQQKTQNDEIYCRQAAEPGKSHARSSRGLCRLGTFRLSLWWCKSGFLLQTSPRRPVRAVSRKSEQPWCDPRHTAAQISRRRPPGANEQEHRAPARPPKLEGGDKAGATQLSELSPCNSPTLRTHTCGDQAVICR